MVDNNYRKMDDILTQTWWSHARFSRVGNAIAEVFASNPVVQQKIVANFKSHKNKLSYYDFFNHLEFDLKVRLKDWESDALESRLDRLGLAYVDYWEFVEFMEDFEVVFDEPERPELDVEAQLEAKLNISYKDYKLTKADQF
jgi:hypothetical protein